MSDFDKLLANLRLGTEDLSKDVSKAVEQIDKLNKKAETIDNAFSGTSSSGGNLKKMTTELLDISKNMTKVSKDIADKYEATAKRVKTAQVSIMETIKHNVDTGKQSYEEAYASAKKYHDMVSQQYAKEMASNKGKAMNATRYGKDISAYNPYDTDATQRELMSVEKYMAQLNVKVAKAKQDMAKQAREAMSQELMGQKSTVYSNDLAGYKLYLEQMASSDRVSNDERIAIEKQLSETKRAIQKESEAEGKASAKRKAEEEKAQAKLIEAEKKASAKREQETKKALEKESLDETKLAKAREIEMEKSIKKESLAELRKAISLQQVEYKDNLQEFKEYCEKLLASDKLTIEHQIQLRNKLSTVEKADANERKKALQAEMRLEKQASDQLEKNTKEQIKLEKQQLVEMNKQLKATQPQIDKNSPVQKFDNITNYAFDAGIIYGAVNGVKNLITEYNQLEVSMANLQRVAPNLSSFQVNEITDGLMNIAGLTNNTVSNVQDIANYWVRVSDEIANSSELLTYLTDVTSVAMNVGGFENAEEAVQLLSASINQMGMEWEDAGSILDGWMKIADTTAVGSAKDLADMVLRTGTQAKMLGMDINQLNGIMGIFANNMAKDGEEAGTAMKTVFSYFTDSKAIDVLYKHGVNVMKNAEEYRNFADVMVDLQLKYKELEAEGNDVAIREMNNALGRTRRIDYVGTLINNFDQFNEMVISSADSIGYAGEQNDKMMETLEAKLNQLKVAFTQLAKGMGDSGMTDDLKGVLEFAIRGMDAINNMDESTKRFLLTMGELMTAYTLAQKASKLVWGSEMSHMIANSIARIAMLTKNQTLLNLARKSGANIEAVSTVATMAETGSVTANTGAKALNNAETLKGNVVGQAEIVQSGQQVVANGAEASSYIALADAKMGASASGGLLTGAVSSLLTPVGLAIGSIMLLTAVFTAHSAQVKKAKEETDRFADAQLVLQEKIQRSKDPTAVVDEFGMEEYNNIISKIDEAKAGYDEAIAKVEELKAKRAELTSAQESANSEYGIPYGSTATGEMSPELLEVTKALGEAQSAVTSYDKELQGLGTTTGTAIDDMTALETVVARSASADMRSAMEVVNKIKAMQAQNDTTRSLIADYERLGSVVNRSTEENQEYQRVISILSATFPALSMTADDTTETINAHTNSMRQSLGAYGQVTNAQMNEILAMAGLSDNAKTLALNTINAELKKTTTVIDQAQARIDAYQAEAKAMGVTNKARVVVSSAHKPTLLSSYSSGLTSSIFNGKYTNDNVYKSAMIKKEKDLSSNINQAQKELRDAEATLAKLEAQKNAVSKIIPYQQHDTSIGKAPYTPQSSKDANSQAQSDAERAREDAQRALEELQREAERLMQERERMVLDMQGKIVNALKTKYTEDRNNRVKALKEMEQAEVDALDERVKVLREEIEALQDTRKDERDNLESLKRNLEMWKNDTSEYGKRKARELQKQIADQEKDMLIDEKERSIDAIEKEKQAVQDAYKARLDSSSDQYDKQLGILDNALKEVNLYKEANALLNGNATAQQKILDLLKEYVPEYANIGQVMGQSLADSMMAEVQDAMDSIAGLKTTGTTETPAPAGSSSGGSSGGSTATPAPTAPTASGANSPPIRKGYNSKGEKLKPSSSLIDYMKSKGYYAGFSDRKAIYDYYANNGVLAKGAYSGSGAQNSSLWARLKKDGFDTGGYTGEWGSQGKFAMLHQKERVLNAQQTKAFENLVYNFLPKIRVGKTLDMAGSTAGTIINNNAPLIQNDIKITNNTPFDVSNKMDNLNRAIKSELQQIGFSRSIGGRR